MSDKLDRIISEVFGIPLDEIDGDISPDSTSRWDSVTHIHLILALESEFELTLTPEEAMDMLSVNLIRIILTEKGVM